MEVLCMNRPIQMISCTDTNGRITPMRFRMMEKEELVTLTIDKVMLTDHHGPRIYDGYFVCQASCEYGKKVVELRYHYATHKWFLENVRDSK